jgi:hypothetical protein
MIDFVRCAFRVSIRKACRALPAYRTTYPLPVSPTRARKQLLRTKRVFLAASSPIAFSPADGDPVMFADL